MEYEKAAELEILELIAHRDEYTQSSIQGRARGIINGIIASAKRGY
jgi:hypothetical protein